VLSFARACPGHVLQWRIKPASGRRVVIAIDNVSITISSNIREKGKQKKGKGGV